MLLSLETPRALPVSPRSSLCTYLDEELHINSMERVDWSKFWHDRYEQSHQSTSPIDPDNTKLPNSRAYVGCYSNPGYHTLHLQVHDDGNLWADCCDRSFPFWLDFKYRPKDEAEDEAEDKDKAGDETEGKFDCDRSEVTIRNTECA